MATRKEQIDFVRRLYPHAVSLYEKGDGAHPLFVVAQAALETGWKIRGIGNNIFGITVGSSWQGKRQLVTTREVFRTPNKRFKAPEEVMSVRPLGNGKWEYRVKRFFRVYDTIEDCLRDHLKLLKRPMYADAWEYRHDPEEYARRIVDETGAKYATDPNYARTMANVIDMVARIVKDNGLDVKPAPAITPHTLVKSSEVPEKNATQYIEYCLEDGTIKRYMI